jgi:hypothetical protein
MKNQTWVSLASVVALSACGVSDSKRGATNSSFTSPRIGDDYARAVASLPDWNGNWIMTGGRNDRVRIMFDPENVSAPDDPGHGLDFGVLPGSYDTLVPYKPEFKKLYAERIQMALDGKSPDPLGACMQPHGMPRQMSGIPIGPEIHVTPSMVLINWTYLGAQRRIYIDGRQHPEPGVLPKDYMGHSIGRWDGDTLIVDTVNILAGIYDMSGAPFSEQIHVTERIRLVEKNLLEDALTVEDPVMLERPWQVTRHYKRAEPRYPNLVLEYCEQGAAVDFSKGYQELVLPSEVEQRSQAIKH